MNAASLFVSPVPLGTFDLAGTPSVSWTVLGELSPPVAGSEIPAGISEGSRIPCLLVVPNIHADFAVNLVTEAASAYANSPSRPRVKDLTPPLKLRARGQALPGPWSLDGAFNNLAELLNRLYHKVNAGLKAGDETGLRRILWTAWDCYPWVFFWDPMHALARSWLEFEGELGVEEVTLAVVEWMARGGPGRPGGRPDGGTAEVEDEVGLYRLIQDYENVGAISKHTAGPMTAALWFETPYPSETQVRTVRERVRSRERRLRKRFVVPMLLPFHEEALTVDAFLDRTWLTWADERVPEPYRLTGQRGDSAHLAIAWREALTDWCMTAPTERRLRVICSGRWDSFWPCDLPSDVPPAPDFGVPPPEIATPRPGEDPEACGCRIVQWASEQHFHPPRRTPPWFTDEKQRQAEDRERSLRK